MPVPMWGVLVLPVMLLVDFYLQARTRARRRWPVFTLHCLALVLAFLVSASGYRNEPPPKAPLNQNSVTVRGNLR